LGPKGKRKEGSTNPNGRQNLAQTKLWGLPPKVQPVPKVKRMGTNSRKGKPRNTPDLILQKTLPTKCPRDNPREIQGEKNPKEFSSRWKGNPRTFEA